MSADKASSKSLTVHFENLDALRFLAALSVLLFHYFRDLNAFYPNFSGNKIFLGLLSVFDKGSLGVNFFFVLSGFLITYLILEEKNRTGSFHLGKFLVRRTLRIWPLYFIIVLIGFVVFPIVFDGFSTSHQVQNYIFFLANFDEIWYGANDPVNFLTSPWSIAVEEQFYLFWGLLLFVILQLKTVSLEGLLILLSIGSLYFRFHFLGSDNILYYHTFSVSQDLLTGCFIGLSLVRGRMWLDRLSNLSRIGTILVYAVGFAMCLLKNKIFQGDFFVFERLFLSMFFAFIILDQIRGKNSIVKAGAVGLFSRLGYISYGMYMYHLLVMYLLVSLVNSFHWTGYWLIPAYLASAIALTILTAFVSYRLIEKPLLKLKPH